MQGAVDKGAPEQRLILGWTYVARGSALLAMPIQPPAEGRVGRALTERPPMRPAMPRRSAWQPCGATHYYGVFPIRKIYLSV